MPITLEKLFSLTRTISFSFMGETVHVTYAPLRYTGEMQELAAKLMGESGEVREQVKVLREQAEATSKEAIELEEAGDKPGAAEKRREAAEQYEEIAKIEVQLDVREKGSIRDSLAALITTWDVLGSDGAPIATDVPTLKKLSDDFLRHVYLHLADENSADPQTAPDSADGSSTETSSAQSPSGTSSSPRPVPSESPSSSSTNAPGAPDGTPSGASGHGSSSKSSRRKKS